MKITPLIPEGLEGLEDEVNRILEAFVKSGICWICAYENNTYESEAPHAIVNPHVKWGALIDESKRAEIERQNVVKVCDACYAEEKEQNAMLIEIVVEKGRRPIIQDVIEMLEEDE